MKIKERRFLKLIIIIGVFFSTLIFFNLEINAKSTNLSVSVTCNNKELEEYENKTFILKMKTSIHFNISSNTSWEY